MSRKLPPLNALRAFEAAARHLSFTKAAEELNVTQAAVSHQVKALEAALGVTLFRRLNRQVLLSDLGQSYFGPIREALDAIALATQRVAEASGQGALRISVLPSFAAKWLLPRLPRFREAHPEIDVLVAAENALVDFARSDFHLGIRYGRGYYRGLESLRLMNDEIFPVCSPKLLEGPHPLTCPENLAYHILLHDEVLRTADDPDWAYWFQQASMAGARLEGVDPLRGPGYSDSSLVVQAAVAGQGVALARHSLAEDDLNAGRLVRPFGPTIRSNLAYYLAYPPERAGDRRVKAFCEWMLAETAHRRAALENSSDEVGAGDHSTG